MNKTKTLRPVDQKERRTLREALKGLLLFLPRLLKLVIRLMRDERVSRADKAILAATAIYIISPIDFIPDLVPFIGQVDDLYLAGLAVLRLLNRADGRVVREHWDGEIDLKELVQIIVDTAVIFLPKRVGDALVNRVEYGRKRLQLVSEKPASR